MGIELTCLTTLPAFSATAPNFNWSNTLLLLYAVLVRLLIGSERSLTHPYGTLLRDFKLEYLTLGQKVAKIDSPQQ